MVASSVDVVGGWWSDIAREHCGSGRYLVGSGYAPSVVLARIFMGTVKSRLSNFKLRQGLTYREKSQNSRLTLTEKN